MNPLLLITIALLCFAVSTQADETLRPKPAIVGRWSGTAHFFDARLGGTTFPVRLRIRRDGTVIGRVGDAAFVAATFQRHRPWGVSRRGSDMMDYMITGRLAGSIIARDGINAESVFIPLDFEHGRFDAGINAHGSNAEIAPSGILSASTTLTKN